MRNPLSFTARTYNTIYFDLKALYPDKPEWFIIMLAGLFDIAHWYLDAYANDAILESAFTPEAVDNLLAYIDYYRASAQPSSGDISVTLLNTTVLPYTIPKADLRFTCVKPDKNAVDVEAIADKTFNTLTATISVYEGTTEEGSLGFSDGSAWQEFVFPLKARIDGQTVIRVDGVEWAIVDFLVESGPTDEVCRIIRMPDGFSKVRFGDGVTGKIPNVNFEIEFTARFGGGSNGNFVTANGSIFYAGGDTQVESAAFVSAQFSGGADEETIEHARGIAPSLIKVNRRAVTEDDYRLLSLRFSTGITRVRVLPGYYGVGTVGVHIIPTGGGNPSLALKQALQDYLIPISTLSNADVRVRNPNYQSQGITAELKMRASAPFGPAQTLAITFLKLLVHEAAEEVVTKWAEEGVAAAATLLNTYFGNSYANTDYRNLDTMFRVVSDSISTWGSSLALGDCYKICESIPNVDYANVLLPVSNVPVPNDYTLTLGTVTVTQVP
jgi:hypothetical protein